jgi:hypothetical protein
MLRRDYISGTWYPAGFVLAGLPHPLRAQLVDDGCIDDSPESVRAAIEGGAQLIDFVPPELPDEASAD